jgi:hypothetical protein
VVVLEFCQIVNIAIDNDVQVAGLVMRRNVACGKDFRHVDFVLLMEWKKDDKNYQGYISQSQRKGQYNNMGEKERGRRDHKPFIEPFLKHASAKS